MTSQILVFGAGGHAKVVIDIVHAMKELEIIGIVDKNRSANSFFYGYPIIGNDQIGLEYVNSNNQIKVFIAIGEIILRMRVRNKILSVCENVKFATLIHPSAVVSPSVSVAAGTVIMPGVCVNAEVKIGQHCIVNTKASIDHECKLESFVNVSPGATLAGGVVVGERSFIGSGAIVVPGIKIPENSFIRAGALVTKKTLIKTKN